MMSTGFVAFLVNGENTLDLVVTKIICNFAAHFALSTNENTSKLRFRVMPKIGEDYGPMCFRTVILKYNLNYN